MGRSVMNFGRTLTNTALRYPDRVAVVWGAKHTTYQELNDRVNRLAASFADLGLVIGDRVALAMPNRPEYLEVFFSCFKGGFCVVPLDARFKRQEIAYHIRDCRAKAVVYSSELAEQIALAGEELESITHLVAVGDGPKLDVHGAQSHGYESLLMESASRDCKERSVEVDPDHVCWLFYTSGTTGRPKGAMLTHGNLQFVTLAWLADLMQLNPEDVTLHAAPLSHGAGFHAIVSIARGCRQVLPEHVNFNPDAILELIESEQVTNTWLVPTQIKRLVFAPSLPQRHLSKLHSIVYGGAPFHVADLKNALQALGPILIQIYGQGETPMTITYLPKSEHMLALRNPDFEARLASAGYARTGVEVRIVDSDDKAVPPGELGEIVVRGPSVMKGYWERPEDSAHTLRGGWLHTGDIGRMDDRGYVYIVDRAKDLIITGGANVYAREVEEVLLCHSGVRAVAVIGIPDRDWGERVVAVVVPEPSNPPTADELIRYCGARIASYKKPKQVEFLDELPVSNYGKVLKRELRARFAT